MQSLHRNFSHIYVEKAAQHHPRTEALLARFPKSTVISIESYKEILNRNQQQFQIQKKSQKLILAKRSDEFLYDGSAAAPDFGHEHFYYNTLVLNCLYNCEYCYLQGMFPSAHLVAFVNNDDFLAATESKLQELGSMYLCLSYDTDLLALEGILGYSREWIEFSRNHPELIIELRTKSAAVGELKNIKPHPGVVLAWTLSPQPIVQRFEHGTPSLDARLNAMGKAAEAGWKVRVCIDPILPFGDWESDYRTLLARLADAVPSDAISEISLGAFRIGEQYFKRMKRVQPYSALIHQDLVKENGLIGLGTDVERETLKTVSSFVAEYLPDNQIDITAIHEQRQPQRSTF